MDSVTQLVLGASVGHVVGGKVAGRKAVVAGAVGGTIPDLDVIFYPLLDTIQQIGFHRGISHSLLFVAVASPIFGWIVHKLSRAPDVPYPVWVKIGFWAFFTHILLDCFTVYGTGVFEPFSSYRVAFNSVFIIDPLYTIPLIVGLIPVVFGVGGKSIARRFSFWGVMISTSYLCWTLAAKVAVDQDFESHLEDAQITYSRIMTAPTAFNSLLWRALVETDEGFSEGYYSLVARQEPDFRLIEDRAELPDSLRGTPAVRTIKWFSKGFYTVDKHDDAYLLHDLRFGTIGFHEDRFVFTFEILSTDTGPGTAIRQVPASFEGFAEALRDVWRMILGRT